MHIAGRGCRGQAGVLVRAATRDTMHLVDTALMPAALMSAQEHIPMQDFPRRETAEVSDETAKAEQVCMRRRIHTYHVSDETAEAEQVHATDANLNLPKSNLPQRLTRPLQAGGAQVAEGGRQQGKQNIGARNVPAAHAHVALSAACAEGHASNVPGPALSARSPARERDSKGGRERLSATTGGRESSSAATEGRESSSATTGGRENLSATTPARQSISTAIGLAACVQEAGVCAVATTGSGAESPVGEHKRSTGIGARCVCVCVCVCVLHMCVCVCVCVWGRVSLSYMHWQQGWGER